MRGGGADGEIDRDTGGEGVRDPRRVRPKECWKKAEKEVTKAKKKNEE